jgi:hypothetical protein
MPTKNKFEAEATAEETKMILGWHFNFRLLAISLPDNKFIAYGLAQSLSCLTTKNQQQKS